MGGELQGTDPPPTHNHGESVGVGAEGEEPRPEAGVGGLGVEDGVRTDW